LVLFDIVLQRATFLLVRFWTSLLAPRTQGGEDRCGGSHPFLAIVSGFANKGNENAQAFRTRTNV